MSGLQMMGLGILVIIGGSLIGFWLNDDFFIGLADIGTIIFIGGIMIKAVEVFSFYSFEVHIKRRIKNE